MARSTHSQSPSLSRDFFLLASLVGLSLIPRLSLLGLRAFEIFHSDHAVFGLMAKHILEGKWMVY